MSGITRKPIFISSESLFYVGKKNFHFATFEEGFDDSENVFLVNVMVTVIFIYLCDFFLRGWGVIYNGFLMFFFF
jgi:hypothetical protein